MIVVAHVGGLPVEETIAQLASVGIVVLVMARERTRRFRARLRGHTKPRCEANQERSCCDG